MKKGITFILSTLLVLPLIGGFKLSTVNAIDIDEMNIEQKEEYANSIFNPDEVKRLIDEGEKKPIEADIKCLTRSATGTYPSRKGVILYTPDKYKGIIPTGHAAMVLSGSSVIEALSNGVVWGDNDWNKTKTQAYGLGVKGTSVNEDASAAEYCRKQIGKPYNWNFSSIHRRDQFYCSHLIYAAYLDTCRVDLNTGTFDGSIGSEAIHPSELLSGPKTTLLYRKK